MLAMIRGILKRRQGAAMLVNMVIVAMMMGIMATSFVQLSSAQFANADAYRFAYQAQQFVETKSNEIGVMPYAALANEPKALVAGTTNWYREVIVGPETALAFNNRQRPVTVNVYYGTETNPRASVIKYPSIAGTVVFAGTIAAWAGNVADIPYGWVLCDGANGTPDLRSRFIYGAGSDVNTKGGYVSGWNNVNGHLPPGVTGGEEMHLLTENEMPSHGHTGITDVQGAHNHGYIWEIPERPWDGDYMVSDNAMIQVGTHRQIRNGTTDIGGSHAHNLVLNNTGGGAAHNIMPRFYSLAYIMRVNR